MEVSSSVWRFLSMQKWRMHEENCSGSARDSGADDGDLAIATLPSAMRSDQGLTKPPRNAAVARGRAHNQHASRVRSPDLLQRAR